MTTPILALSEIAEGVASQAALHNTALRQFEARTSRVLSRSTTAPPGSPAEGDAYIVPTGASGVWSGKTSQIAAWIGGAWSYFVPIEGCATLWVNDEDLLATYDGAAWTNASVGGLPTFVDHETPAGLINGSNAAFALAHMPNPTTSLVVFLNGIRLLHTAYALSAGPTLTYSTAPASGDVHVVSYRF